MAVVTTNLIRDPSAEGVLADGMWASLSGATIGETTSEKLYGAQSLSVVSAASGGSGCRFTTASSLGFTGAASVYCASAYVKGSGALYVRVGVVYGDATFTEATQTDFTATGTWIRYTAGLLTLNAAKTVDYMFVDVRNQDATSNTYWVDGVQLEAGSTPTDYFDGDTADTATDVYDWTGTVHQSASTRTHTDPAASDPIPRRTFNVRTNALLRR